MRSIIGVAITDGEIRPVPKFGLTLSEMIHAYGSEQLVRQLRKIGALRPAEENTKVQLFDTGHAAEVWAKYVRGDYARLLEEVRR